MMDEIEKAVTDRNRNDTLRRVAGDWQDMSTAPKDGSYIDVWTGAGIMTVYWNDMAQNWAGGHTHIWPPTHWMPVRLGPHDE